MMKKSLQLLSEAGESLDYLRDEVRHLGLSVTELETLVEAYRAFVVGATDVSASPRWPGERICGGDTEKVLGLNNSPSLAEKEDVLADETDTEGEILERAFRQAARLGNAGSPWDKKQKDTIRVKHTPT